MKKTVFIFLAAAALCGCSGVPEIIENHPEKASFTKIADGSAKKITLFNGRNLDGWYTFSQKYGIDNDTEGQFKVRGGEIHLKGEPMGYICTKGSYENYYLKIVFRWGEERYAPRLGEPRDSGVLYHFPDGVADVLWPKSIECQIQEGDCGDYWCVGGTWADSDNEGRMEGSQKRIFRTENFEKPRGEWNTIEIIACGDRSEHYVNGHLVNSARNLTTTQGKILFQLEGAEIFYKTIELLPLK